MKHIFTLDDMVTAFMKGKSNIDDELFSIELKLLEKTRLKQFRWGSPKNTIKKHELNKKLRSDKK
jgi:hypothetical protein